MLLHTAGGMVSGDRLMYEIVLGENSRVRLTTAAAGKIYRRQEKAPWSHQVVTLNLAAQARVKWLPQETILYEQAQFHQSFQIQLAPGARFQGGEIIRLGRTARGEKFARGQWRSDWDIWQENTLVWGEKQKIIGTPTIRDCPNALGTFPILATYLDLGKGVPGKSLEVFNTLASETITQGQWGLTLTAMPGWLFRYRGTSVHEVQETIQKFVDSAP